MKFQPLKVLEVKPETAQAYTIKFEAPEDWLNFNPGQYLTLKTRINGEEFRRAYSLSSCPVADDFLSVTIKAIDDGRVSNHLKNNLRPGDEMEVLPPMGKFFVELDPSKKRHFLLIGGGSGITPLMSILRSVLEKEKDSKVTLIYSNSEEDGIIFRDELDRLSQQEPGRLKVEHILSRPNLTWPGKTGRLEGEIARDLIRDAIAEIHDPFSVYLCGPQGMMDNAEKALELLGVAEKQINREYYSAPLPDLDDEEEISYEIITRKITVMLDGKEYKDVVVEADSNILNAVMDMGLDPPFACEEGVCSTCRAKLHSGLIQMMVRDGLSDEELEANYILTCQSSPLTDDVVIEFA